MCGTTAETTIDLQGAASRNPRTAQLRRPLKQNKTIYNIYTTIF